LRHIASRIVACSLVGLLAACSGGGTIAPAPPGNFPSVVTISPQGKLPSGVAYRIGSGSWIAASTSAATQFSVPIGTTTFSVASACNGLGQTVVNLAVTDTLVVPVACEDGRATPYGPGHVSGTFDATAVGATGALVSATYDLADVSVASGAGSYTNLVTDPYHPEAQTLVLAAKNPTGDFVGFKTIHGIGLVGLPGNNNATVNFPTLTAADAAISEPFSVAGTTGSSTSIGVAYLLDGTNNGFFVTHASKTAYSAVPAADWAAGDSYGVYASTSDTVGSDGFRTIHLGRIAAAAPVAVVLPTLTHLAIDHADLSFPLTYAGLSSSDVAKGYLVAEFDGSTPPEVDIATPAYLAGKSSYGPPSLAGLTGFTTKTAANVTLAEYAVVGLSFQPSPLNDTYLGGYPAAGQSVEAYLSYYDPQASPGLRLRLMQGDRVSVGIPQP